LEAEVYLQLWRSLPSFEARASEDTWVFRVALNTVMAVSRRERKRVEEPFGGRIRSTPVGASEVLGGGRQSARCREIFGR